MELKIVRIEKPDDVNLILGQAHFIKTVEDLHEVLATGVPGAKFGVAFCEASGPALVRWSGTDEELAALARRNALALSCGHMFLILMRGMYPLNVLNAVKLVPEVCRVLCATANPVEVIVAETEQGRGVLGVVDGVKTTGVEREKEQVERKALLRRIGYKLG
jgi:adenosine/AMP kinase